MAIQRGSAWTNAAACFNLGWDLFFTPDGGRVDRTAAKIICSQCVVLNTCLQDALDNGTRAAYGIWGGLTEDERQQVIKLRKANLLAEAEQYIATIHATNARLVAQPAFKTLSAV